MQQFPWLFVAGFSRVTEGLQSARSGRCRRRLYSVHVKTRRLASESTPLQRHQYKRGEKEGRGYRYPFAFLGPLNKEAPPTSTAPLYPFHALWSRASHDRGAT